MDKRSFLFILFLSVSFLFATDCKIARAFDVGPFSIGGAIRANYYFGDYTEPEPDRPSRAKEDGGTFALDTFRINIDYKQDSWVGKLEYRFYPGYDVNNSDGYHFLHTGWIGYNFKNGDQIQVGMNRAPFGPGPYGVSQSWFFDQHYYVGLSDDLDLGVKYIKPMGPLALDMGYYYSGGGDYFGVTRDSARYSYDVVDETGAGYEERHQFNVRGIYTISSTALGVSLEYGMLKSNGPQDDGSHFAGSIHSVSEFDRFKLALQLTYFNFDVKSGQPLGTDKLVQLGAYDFPTLAPAKAWLPAASLSYKIDTAGLKWLDYVLPYIEYSVIVKDESTFNDSRMLTAGAAWASGGWYIYTDLVYSNGNDFVGNEAGYGAPGNLPYFTSNRFGANPTNDWEFRFNINFGYYF